MPPMRRPPCSRRSWTQALARRGMDHVWYGPCVDTNDVGALTLLTGSCHAFGGVGVPLLHMERKRPCCSGAESRPCTLRDWEPSLHTHGLGAVLPHSGAGSRPCTLRDWDPSFHTLGLGAVLPHSWAGFHGRELSSHVQECLSVPLGVRGACAPRVPMPAPASPANMHGNVCGHACPAAVDCVFVPDRCP